MPNRMLRDWTDSLRLDGISAEAERFFIRLIMKADDYGRFHADVRLLKAACFPLLDNLDTGEVEGWLEELSRRRLILLYEAAGRSCLAIVNYGQRLKSSKAKFPPLPGKPADFLPTSEHFPELPGTSRKSPLEEKGSEEEERRISEVEAEAASAAAAAAKRLISAHPRPSYKRNDLDAATDCLARHPDSFDEIMAGTKAYAAAVNAWPEDERQRYIRGISKFFTNDDWRAHPDEWRSRRAAKKSLTTSNAAPPVDPGFRQPNIFDPASGASTGDPAPVDHF
jgi:hypothetical protein